MKIKKIPKKIVGFNQVVYFVILILVLKFGRFCDGKRSSTSTFKLARIGTV
jgi:hypothetical protein